MGEGELHNSGAMRETRSRRAPHGDGGGPKIVVVSSRLALLGTAWMLALFRREGGLKAFRGQRPIVTAVLLVFCSLVFLGSGLSDQCELNPGGG